MFGAVKLTKHPDIDQYKYSGYGIGFDRKGSFSLGNETGRNAIIFGVDMSSSPHVDNKKKDILILGKGPTRIRTYTGYRKIPFSQLYKNNTKFCLSLHYNWANSCSFVNGTEVIKFKAINSETATYSFCLWNISKDFAVDNDVNDVCFNDVFL